MYGFRYCEPHSNPKTKITRMETFKEGIGKCTSEITTMEGEALVAFKVGNTLINKVLTKRYTAFHHNVNDPDDKTILHWHWVDFPEYIEYDCIVVKEL